MCGFVGTSFDIDDKSFADALALIAHRGPDSRGDFADGSMRLGFHRLAIQDLSSAGHQPMASSDEQVWIVFNGEIYNHLQLRDELKPQAYRGTSDTETVLAAYLEHGAEAFAMLHGIFALAIYDTRSAQVIIARDHLGVKPLYYSRSESGFAFASELKAITALGVLDFELNPDAVVDYLEFLWSPGTATPHSHVHKLAAGHFLKFDLDGAVEPRPKRFYEVPYSGRRRQDSEQALTDELDSLLQQAVERQLLSDVPVGFFLSGGIDSSLVVAAARRLTGESQRCYTIADASQVSDGFSDDLGYARAVATHLDVELVEVSAGKDTLDSFDQMIWHLDEPQADPAALQVWSICAGARANGDVVLLGGAAADDLFSGYRRHLALRYDRALGSIPRAAGAAAQTVIARLPGSHPALRRLTKLASGAGLPSIERAASYYSWINRERARQLLNAEASGRLDLTNTGTTRLIDSLSSIEHEPELLNQVLYWDTKYFLPDHNLNYTDKMAMAAGVEVRVPFLDLDLVQFAAELPVELKMQGDVTKYLLRKVARRYLPAEVVDRPKTGFGAPVRQWVDAGYFDERIKLVQKHSTVFDPAALGQLLADCKSGRLDGHYTVWAVLSVDSWLRQFGRR